ncbi:MAG: hypothetical protein NVSMB49_15760 [Ktedonobacteraceae bacterium]
MNRETVDRAWESGAPQQHADYRPRTDGGQARPQGQRNGNWSRNSHNQPSGYSSQNGRGGSRPYNNNRQENFRDNHPGNYRDDRERRDSRDTPRNFDRPAGNANGPRPARPPYGQERRDFGEQRFNDSRNSFRSPNRRDGNERQQFQDRGNQQRSSRYNDRSSHRSYGAGPQHGVSNPRWQSRPGEQRSYTRGPEREFNPRSDNDGERFEGDYEHFEERNTRPAHSIERPFEGRNTPNTRPPRPVNKAFEDHNTHSERPPRPAERPFRGSHSPQNRSERRVSDQKSEGQPEQHVTRLPDGRVLKGPRPAQRKNAQFWTGITKDTSDLVTPIHETIDRPTQEALPAEVVEMPSMPENVEMPSVTEGVATVGQSPDAGISDETVTKEAPQKRRTRVASAVARNKKPRSATGSKPSQRGFKWPTQE